jgi:pre-mRNA cleavage complex 2 protein Pcf11
LDWHFRQNKREKEEINKAHSREWYYSLADWILYEELSEESLSQQENDQMSNNHLQSSNGESNKEHANNSDNHDTTNNPNFSSIFDQSSRDLRTFNSSGTMTCPATDDIGDSCCICKDPFEIFWFEEREEWHFKDAIRVENRIYHPICFEDAREVSQTAIIRINLKLPQNFTEKSPKNDKTPTKFR